MEEILTCIFGIIIVFVCMIFLNDCIANNEEKLEIIKNTKEYFIYDECYFIDDKYYCYNNEVEK